MPITRSSHQVISSTSQFKAQLIERELVKLQNDLNIAVINNLKSISKRVHVTAKISISKDLYPYLL